MHINIAEFGRSNASVATYLCAFVCVFVCLSALCMCKCQICFTLANYKSPAAREL
jgi:hypothetical protein